MQGSGVAYSIAYSVRHDFLKNVSLIEQELVRIGNGSRLAGVKRIVQQHGYPAINMSLRGCVRFLKSGEQLNVYEATARRIAGTNLDLETEVRNQLDKWYDRRKTVDSLFGFARDTHYAALNIGGGGAQRYGDCCVVLSRDHWATMSTCFGGDTLRTIFDPDGRRVLSDDECMQLFVIGEDFCRLSILKHQSYIRSGATARHVDPRALRAVLEDADSLIEFHLHGPVLTDQIESIIMPAAKMRAQYARAIRWDDLGQPETEEYGEVPYFLELLKLCDNRGIALVEAEEA